MSNPPTIRLAVIDTDSAFLTVLGNRLDGSDWEHRVLGGSVPIEELVSMKLNALLVDISLLGPQGWEFLERVCSSVPGLGVLVCTMQSTVAQRVRVLAGHDEDNPLRHRNGVVGVALVVATEQCHVDGRFHAVRPIR